VTGYAELQVTSNCSFLRGASHVEELMAQARLLGLRALGITDRNTLAGIARAHQRAEEAGIRLVAGCRLDLRDGLSVLVYPTDRAAYARLCRLLSIGKGRAGKKAPATSAGRTSPGMVRDCWRSFCRMPRTPRLPIASPGCGRISATGAISR
jgi:DNA polymerase III alpha subunit